MSNVLLAKKLVFALAFMTAASIASSAMADTPWQQGHPRREEVNNRLGNQNARIHQEVKEGDITRQQAASLHQDDHQIRQEERAMASQNGGHITKLEQASLNQQENGVSRQIGH